MRNAENKKNTDKIVEDKNCIRKNEKKMNKKKFYHWILELCQSA